jgi:hypothetical protein
MKKRWLFLLAASLAGVMLSAHAEAASFTITDLTEGGPIVSLAGFDLFIIDVKPEFVDVSGLLPVTATPAPLTPATTFVLLTEPPGDPSGPGVSDIIRLVNTEIQADPSLGPYQRTTVTFWSDGATGFDDALTLALAASAPSVLETGALQDITALLGVNFPNQNLQVIVQSDVEGPTPVPEAATLSLLAAGLACCRFMIRRRR